MAWKKYRKITPELLELMKKLRYQGYSYNEIARRLNVGYGTVQYHLNEVQRAKTLERSKRYARKPPTEEQRLRRRAYMRQYMRERYKADEEFRKRLIELSKQYQKKKNEN